MYARNILLRRQKDFRFEAECRMLIPHLYPGQNAGMTCYYDENTFIKYGIFATVEEKPRLMLQTIEYIGDEVIKHEPLEIDISKGYIYLKIDVNYLHRTFYMKYDGQEYRKVTALNNVYYLCDEGLKKGKRFTGAMIGMYAYAGDCGSRYVDEYGRHGTDEMYAEFDYFSYKAI
jgi:xylan 1,4-beta-xylosidase